MKNYTVKIPITGYIEMEIEAENEDVAIMKAIEEGTLEDIAEWDTHKHVCEGNVCYALLNDIEVYEN